MTIDERFEKMAERHEALAQTVEMLVMENRATGEKLAKTIEFAGGLSKQIGELGKYTSEVANATARLLSIAEAHENRITRLEGQL